MQTLLNEILDEVRPLIGKGKVADYIPALADVPAQQLGIALDDARWRPVAVARGQTRGALHCPAGTWTLGHSGEGFAFDNECATHPVGLPACDIDRAVRGREKPSDHVPVIARFG